MSKSKLIKKALHHLIRILPFLVVTMFGVPIIGMAGTELAKLIGIKTVPVTVTGTGSMYPSLYWSTLEGGPEDESKKVVEEYRTTPHLYRRFEGITIAGHTYLRKSVGYGDMVAFKNEKTVEILKNDDKDITNGFIKRVVGVGGDTIELRDGFVYRNGELISEPYIDTPRSTYGGTSLKDCTKITIPPDSYFVLGDNRKVSSDSRFELGLIQGSDIDYVLPYTKQLIYQSLWRDTLKDRDLQGSPSLSGDEFVNLVNKERMGKGIAKLSLYPSLAKSTMLRGEHLLADEKTNYSMGQAIASAGYTNIVLGEFVSRGHFSAKELLENLMFNTGTAKQIMSKDFSDLGISAVNKEIDGCPTQIIVGHLGGYIPASYDEKTVSSWQSLRDNLRSILPSWEQAVSYDQIDQTKLASLLSILRRRLTLAEEILSTMDKKEWLNDSQLARIKADDQDASRADILVKDLNKE